MLMMNAVIMPCQRSVYPGVSVPCVLYVCQPSQSMDNAKTKKGKSSEFDSSSWTSRFKKKERRKLGIFGVVLLTKERRCEKLCKK